MTKIATLYGLFKLHALGVFSAAAEFFGYVANFIGNTVGFTECNYNISCGKFIIFYLIFTLAFIAFAIYKFTKYKNKKKGALVVGGTSLIFTPIFLFIGFPIPQINYFLPHGNMLLVMTFAIAFIGGAISRIGEKKKGIKKLFLYLFLILLTIIAFSELNQSSKCIEGDCNNGYGTYTFVSGKFAGDKYVGQFKNKKQHGQGTYTWANGDKYVGEWKKGKEHGQGTLTFEESGNKYVGEFKNGKQNGQATYIFASGNKYVGEYKDGERHGQGIYTWANGAKHVGEFKDDKRHGQGTYTRADGTVKKGIWENDELKEIKSKLGFYLELPLTWKVIDNQNIEELVKESEVVDKEVFEVLLELAEAEGVNPNALYIFPTYANPKLNNVNINFMPMEEGAFSESDMAVFCDSLLELYRSLLNLPSLKQYECKLSKLIPKFHSVIELKHDGVVKGTYNIQFFFDDRSNAKSLAVTLGCEFDNCEILKKETIRIINSIRF